MEGGLVANDAENGCFLGKAGDGCNVAVDAGKAPVGEKTGALFGKEEVVSVSDGHAVAEEDGKVGGEHFGDGAHGVGFGEGAVFFKDGLEIFPLVEPIGIGVGFELLAEFGDVRLGSCGEDAARVLQGRVRTDMEVLWFEFFEPVEDPLGGHPFAKMEDK